ncbi:MAG TPA: hypothetical protein VK277_14335 [Acidimicrobiales bacterium]|nr:hypothetical protein [Acidimicrobiales bacterium]
MEIFLERLLLELVAIALQLAVLRLVQWLRSRPSAALRMVEAA